MFRRSRPPRIRKIALEVPPSAPPMQGASSVQAMEIVSPNDENPDVVVEKAIEPSCQCLLDSRLAPKATFTSHAQTSTMLPPFLLAGGNRRAWETFASTLRQQRNAVILLHGPTGCGKTRGVIECARCTLGMSIYELNASGVRGTEEFTRDIEQVAGTRTLLGSRLILLDDLEGFDEVYIACVIKIIKKRTTADGPMVITCNNPFHRALVGLRPLDIVRMRMYAPSPKQMALAWKTIRKDVSPLILERHVQNSLGNFHQLGLLIRSFCDSRPDTHVDTFETTQKRIAGTTTVDDWKRAGESHILTAILHENYCNLAEHCNNADLAMERAGAFIDLLSQTDGVDSGMKLDVLGRAAGVVLHTLNAPTLRLSTRFKQKERVDVDLPPLLLGIQTR